MHIRFLILQESLPLFVVREYLLNLKWLQDNELKGFKNGEFNITGSAVDHCILELQSQLQKLGGMKVDSDFG